jgi:hypothetical protein
MAELDAMTPRFSQWLPGEEVPEKHWMYRLAKKYWFYDFNAYRDVAHDAATKAQQLRDTLVPPAPTPASVAATPANTQRSPSLIP